MTIEQMTRQDFWALPLLDEMEDYDIDCIVLLPTRRRHGSGYNLFSIAVCKGWTAIGRTREYDVTSLFPSRENRIGFDCLSKSCLMRVFFEPKRYKIKPLLSMISDINSIVFKKGE